MKRSFIFFILTVFLIIDSTAQEPIRIAVAGMSHGHISFILGRPNKGDFILSGVWDSNQTLAMELSNRYRFSPDLVYSDLENMLDEVKPEAVVAFGSIYDHLEVVEACAPRGIHVMVEKPLAVNMQHAKRMAELAEMHQIHLLTNYETSWYPSTAEAFRLLNEENTTGPVKKVVIHDGHKGPKEIGCEQVFLDWLTDPVLNGGGALTDFGCYGANLMTALTGGIKPLSVTAVTRQFKPDIYPKVDDEATIIVSYPESQCIIQASWNWPFDRKDMEIYGRWGYIKTINRSDMIIRGKGMKEEKPVKVLADDVPVYEDPFSYFADIIHGKIKMEPYGLYSLENNLQVVEILDAARESAKTGKTVFFEH
jgi:predicted dehydrogenase